MPDQVKYTQKLKGDKVLVIGGSSGIGFGVAEACLENGCTVIISSSNQDKIDKCISKLQEAYPSAKEKISGHACDLSNQSKLEENLKALFEKVGKGIDHVVFTAGDPLSIVPLSSLTIDLAQKAGTIRFFAPLFVGKIAPGYMSEGPKSSIVLTTGSVSEKPNRDWTVVNGFATGLQGLCRGLALDLEPVRVNLVSPGLLKTELWSGMREDAREGMYEKIGKELPTGRVGEVEDIAESYLYLMKDQNITGAMISSSGGKLLV